MVATTSLCVGSQNRLRSRLSSKRPLTMLLMHAIATMMVLMLVATNVYADSTSNADDDEQHFVIEREFRYVTYGSLVKIANTEIDYILHTQNANYPSREDSSGQQAVTAAPAADGGSLFLVQAAFGEPTPGRGTPVECGNVIRLYHKPTDTYLHSHSRFKALISGYQEVSAFGARDGGDNWVLECSSKGAPGDSSGWAKLWAADSKKSGDASASNKVWMREMPFGLRHRDTNMYLMTGKAYEYESVITGQLEVFGYKKHVSGGNWRATEGVYFEVNDKLLKHIFNASGTLPNEAERDDL